MWPLGRKGSSGFSGSSTAEDVTNGINGAGLTAIVTGVCRMIGKYILKTVPQGAATTCYVALNPQVKGVSGHFLLTHLLLDTMKKAARESGREGRIVNVSSEAHRFAYSEGIRFDKLNDPSSYHNWRAYGQSKLANILHAKELTKRLKEENVEITANCLHPGGIDTNLFRHSTFVGGVCRMIGKYILKTVPQGAATTCYVALNPQVKGVSGEYFSNSNLAKPTSLARDATFAQKLWDFSMDLIS